MKLRVGKGRIVKKKGSDFVETRRNERAMTPTAKNKGKGIVQETNGSADGRYSNPKLFNTPTRNAGSLALLLTGSAVASRHPVTHKTEATFGLLGEEESINKIAINGDNSFLAAAISNEIEVFSPSTGQHLGSFVAHGNKITSLTFEEVSAPSVLFSSSCDGTVKVWDLRIDGQLKAGPTTGDASGEVLKLQATTELWSCSKGGVANHMIAAGGKAKVLLWDWRTKDATPFNNYHNDAVTQVLFNPRKKELLLSASKDSKMKLMDTSLLDEDLFRDYLTMDAGMPVKSIGFYGKKFDKIWCATFAETLSLWNWKERTLLMELGISPEQAPHGWDHIKVEQLIDCDYSSSADCLWLAVGNELGSLGYFPLTDRKASVGHAGGVLVGGHSSSIQCICRPKAEHRCLFWTGGNDGKLCSWFQDEFGSRSWVCTALL